MDERAATEGPSPSTEAEIGDVDDASDDDEVEGHSMAISANFAIDISGVATPTVPPVLGPDGRRTSGGDSSADPKPQVR